MLARYVPWYLILSSLVYAVSGMWYQICVEMLYSSVARVPPQVHHRWNSLTIFTKNLHRRCSTAFLIHSSMLCLKYCKTNRFLKSEKSSYGILRQRGARYDMNVAAPKVSKTFQDIYRRGVFCNEPGEKAFCWYSVLTSLEMSGFPKTRKFVLKLCASLYITSTKILKKENFEVSFNIFHSLS